MEMLRRTASCGLVVLLLVLAGCATNPVSGKREFSLVSPAQELQIGGEGYQAVLKEYGAYGDARLQAYVDSIGQALARVSHQPDLDWHFTLLDDPTVNAFAMPGGYIYITRGILAHLNSEAQLAGVLGHEIGHVTARHSAQRLTQQQVAGLGLGLASIFSEGFRRYSDAAQTALGLMFLKYSRGDENQADELGVGYAAKAGYDPREIPETYVMLGRIGARSGQRLPTFLSTHPDPGDRENRTRQLATQATAGKSGLVIRGPGYVRRLNGVVYGQDPRHGYFEGAHFYHPELRFHMEFPAGWRTENSRQAVMAVAPSDQAAIQLTLSDPKGLSASGYVDQLERAGRIAGSQGGAESIGGFPSWAGRVSVPRQDGGQTTLAAVFIKRSDSQMFEILGQSRQTGDALESQIFTTARSFRTLADSRRLAAEPDRVRVVSVDQQGSFDAVATRLAPGGADLDDLAVLNNLDRDQGVLKGQLLKVVDPGRR